MKEDKRADVIYEFLGRLTTQKKTIKLGASQVCGPIAEEAKKFLDEKGWEPTFRWQHNMNRAQYFVERTWESLRFKLGFVQ